MFSVFIIIYASAIVLGCSFMIFILWKYNIHGVVNLVEKPCPRCSKKKLNEEEEQLAEYGLT